MEGYEILRMVLLRNCAEFMNSETFNKFPYSPRKNHHLHPLYIYIKKVDKSGPV